MSLFTLLIAVGKELLPFLKESLLEGQTFRTWLKGNWLTFAWLVNTLALTLMIAHLSDLVIKARANEHKVTKQWEQVLPPLHTVLLDYKRLRRENASLQTQVNALNNKQAQYEKWMTTCGVNYQDAGQCPVRAAEKPAVVPPRPKPIRQQLVRPRQENPAVIDNIRDLLTDPSKDK